MLTCNRPLAARVCRLLLSAGLGHLWSGREPTAQFEQLVTDLGESQQSLAHLVAAIWSGDRRLTVAEFVGRATPDSLAIFGTLLVASAYGDVGIRDWLAIQEEGRQRSEHDDDDGVVH